MSSEAEQATKLIVAWLVRHGKEMADYPHTVRITTHEGKAFEILYTAKNTTNNIQLDISNSVSLTLLQPSDEWIDIIANIHEQVERIAQ